MDKPEGKKLTKEGLESLKEKVDNCLWLKINNCTEDFGAWFKKLFAHITALEGEFEERIEKEKAAWLKHVRIRDLRIAKLLKLIRDRKALFKEKGAASKYFEGLAIAYLKRGNDWFDIARKKDGEIERLSKRDCSATVELCYSTTIDPFKREELKILNVGVADNCYVVESQVVTALQEERDTLKQKVEELEKQVTPEYIAAITSSAINTATQYLQDKNKDLQATIEKMKKAAKKLHTHPMLERDIPYGGLDHHAHIVVDKYLFDELKQACTEEEKGTIEDYAKKHLELNADAYDRAVINLGEKKPCPDCNPELKGMILNLALNEWVKCKTCNGPREVEGCPDCGGWHVLDRVDLGCGGPQKPPRPKGDNPHG
ncbi:hypothetical protein KAR91_31695 [Candidatus Pacearchaeota archaeon]|nr:hypothetical protein [Candidatus Pacearchaeota archaeon]